MKEYKYRSNLDMFTFPYFRQRRKSTKITLGKFKRISEDGNVVRKSGKPDYVTLFSDQYRSGGPTKVFVRVFKKINIKCKSSKSLLNLNLITSYFRNAKYIQPFSSMHSNMSRILEDDMYFDECNSITLKEKAERRRRHD